MLGVLVVALALAWFSTVAIHPSSWVTGGAWFVLFANIWFLVVGLTTTLVERRR